MLISIDYQTSDGEEKNSENDFDYLYIILEIPDNGIELRFCEMTNEDIDNFLKNKYYELDDERNNFKIDANNDTIYITTSPYVRVGCRGADITVETKGGQQLYNMIHDIYYPNDNQLS